MRAAAKITVLLALIMAGCLVPSRLVYTTSPSLDYNVFLIAESNPSNLEKSDYVLFDFDNSIYRNPSLPSTAIKKIVCSPGEKLEVRGNDYFCQGRYLGRAKDYTMKGQRLSKFSFSGEIPHGHFFVMGSHKDSYDSRYYGFVSTNKMKFRVIPLI